MTSARAAMTSRASFFHVVVVALDDRREVYVQLAESTLLLCDYIHCGQVL